MKVKIAAIVENQFPEFIKNESPLLVEFVKQYYISQDVVGSSNDLITNLENYTKIENVTNKVSSTVLENDISFDDLEINVLSTNGFPDSYGLLRINSEIITYTSKTDTTFLGCVRGFSGVYNSELEFASTESDFHNSGDIVENLSILFLDKFLDKIKKKLIPGFEGRTFNSKLNQTTFIQNSKSFYSSKGTDVSFEILFNALYGESVQVIKPRDFLFTPSAAEYRVTKDLVVEAFYGNPLLLENGTLFQDDKLGNNIAKGAISKVEEIVRGDRTYYVLSLDYDFNKDISVSGSVFGEFYIHSKTQLTSDVTIDSDTLDVDSTVGFPNSGELILDNDTVSYTSKSLTQFFGCSNITKDYSKGTSIIIKDFAYGFNGSDTIAVRISGIIGDFKEVESAYNINTNDKIRIKSLGKTSTDIRTKNWIYNIPVSYNINSLILIDSSSSKYQVETIDENNIGIGDNVDVINKDGSIVSSAVISIVNLKSFIIQAQGSVSFNNVDYVEKKLSKSFLTNYSELYKVSTNVQNVYEDDKDVYVTSSSIPTYFNQSIDVNDRGLQITENKNGYEIIKINHGFLSGDIVVYNFEGTNNHLGIPKGTYFVKRNSTDSISLSSSRANLASNSLIKFSGSANGGVSKLSYNDFSLKSLKNQKLVRKIPSEKLSKDTVETPLGNIGILNNGVEITNYKSKDVVYYGPVVAIDVISPGENYDVINPPIITTTDSSGSGLTAHCEVKGSLKEIRLIERGINFTEEPTIKISGGNGTGAKAKVELGQFEHSVVFNSSDISSNIVGFTTFHGFNQVEQIIYKPDGSSKVIGITTDAQYYARKVDDLRISLHKTYDDAISNSNIIPLSFTGFTKHRFQTANPKTKISSIVVTETGSGYTNKKIAVSSSGINTANNYIYKPNHGYKTGEKIIYQSYTNSPIVGISTNVSYYVTADQDFFRLSEVATAGISTSEDFFFKTEQFVNISNSGIGTHYFNYEPIKVELISNSQTTSYSAKIQPIVRGEITSVSIENGGQNYGQENILNYNRQPAVELSSGSGASIQAIVVDGKINQILIIDPGSNYFAPPEIIISGTGQNAKLTPVVENGLIVDVKIISAGYGYDSKNITLTVIPAGSNAQILTTAKSWTINQIERLIISNQINPDDGIICNGINSNYQLQYVHGYSPRYLRRILTTKKYVSGELVYQPDLQIENNVELYSDAHSPIIGWSYDGHPIYGPYGFDTTEGGSVRHMKSGYTLIPNQDNRPVVSLYPEGIFVEDYVFTNDGDLDDHNGRYCKTPEFPKGTYAYFATINGDQLESGGPFEKYYKPAFPYFIGKTFNSYPEEFNYNSKSNQDDIDFNKTGWLRNTEPFKLNSISSKYNYLFKPFDIVEQTATIDSTLTGSIEFVNVISGGDNYKVKDKISFNNAETGGNDARAEVSSVRGKNVIEIGVASTSIFNVEFYSTDQNRVVGVSSLPHSLNDNDTVLINNLNKNKSSLQSNFTVTTSKNQLTLFADVNVSGITGITTYFNVYGNLNSTNIRENDIYQVDNEKIKILSIDKNSSRLFVERAVLNSSSGYHTVGASLIEAPRRFFIDEVDKFINSKTNRELYFNPSESVGIGIGTTVVFSNPGTGITNTFIPSKNIFIPEHDLDTGEKLTYKINGGSPIVVSNNGINTSVLLDNSTLYAVKFSNNFIGLSTEKVGIGTTGTFVGYNTTAPAKILHYHSYGYGTKHSFITNYDSTLGQVNKNTATVYTDQNPELSLKDTVDITVRPTNSKTIKVVYNSIKELLLINPRIFSAQDVNLSNDTITLSNHNYFTGQKILYSSDSPISGLLSNETYFVVVKNSNEISLCSTYYDSQLENPNVINFASQSIGTLYEVNPRIEVIKNQSVIFDLSDSSLSFFDGSELLSAFDFDLYKDSNFINEFKTTYHTASFNVKKIGRIGIDTNATLSLYYDEELQTELYYNLIPLKTAKIFVDREIISNNIINYVDSQYSGKQIVSGIGTTSFSYNLQRLPENTKYTSNISYTTSSKTASGPINDIFVISGGSDYKSLPGISSIVSQLGSGAILDVESKSIGKINNVTVNDVGYDYPSDLTLTPLTQTPVILKIIPQSTLKSVGIASQGKNYLYPPDLILLDGLTLKQIKDVDLRYTLGSTQVDIIRNSKGLNNVQPFIIPTNNSNSIILESISFNETTKEVTAVLAESYSSLAEFPFRVGDRILVENVAITDDPLAKGYNSSLYEYARFLVTAITPNIGFSNGSVTYSLNGHLNESEYPGVQDATFTTGTITPESFFPIFDIQLEKNLFLVGETVTYSNNSGIVESWNKENELLTISTNSEFQIGMNIIGSGSLSSGIISKINDFKSQYIIDSSAVVRKGWRTEKGFLDNELQHLPDNDYYQNFSYSLRSKVNYDTWNNAVSSLNHISGFKKFADLIVESDSSVGIGTTLSDGFNDNSDNADQDETNIETVIYIESEVDLNCYDDFDLASENSYIVDNKLTSNEIYFNSEILQDYSQAIGNRVLIIDDISSEFDGSKKEFNLTSNNLNVFKRSFNSINLVDSNTISLENHYFTNGEKVLYSYVGSPVGINTISISGIGSTNILPSEVYIIKYNESTIGFSTSAENALKDIPSPIIIQNVGIGSTHILSSATQLSKVVLTLGGIIQSPITATEITTQLSSNVGIGSTVIYFYNTSSFSSGEFAKIDDEIVKIISVGAAATNSIQIERGIVGTAVTTHAFNNTVYKVSGDYNIIDNTLYFIEPPKGPTPIGTTSGSLDNLDYVGITTTLNFTGRVFLKNGEPTGTNSAYSTNYVFDDISNSFNGITTSFILKNKGNNITGIENNNASILIGEVFQSPSDFQGSIKTYGGYTLKETGGITSIRFLSSSEPQSYNSNVSGIPVGGSIVSIGFTENYGFQPLVAAGGTAIVSIAGTIQSVSIGNSGSGYRPGLQVVNVGVYTSSTDRTNKTNVGIASIIDGRVVSVAITNPGSDFDRFKPPLVIIDDPLPYTNLPVKYVSPVNGIGTGARANLTVGLGSSIIDFDFTNRGFAYKKGDVLTIDIGGATGIPTFVYGLTTSGGGGGGGGSLYPVCTNGLTIGTIVAAGPAGYSCTLGDSLITFTDDIAELDSDSGNAYIDFVDSPTSQQIQFKGLNFQDISAFLYYIESLQNIIPNYPANNTYTNVSQTIQQSDPNVPPLEDTIFTTGNLPSSSAEVISIVEIDSSQYPDGPRLTAMTHTISKITTGGGGGGEGGISSVRYAPFLMTVEEIYKQKFSGWSFGQLQIMDSIEPLFNGTRRLFPIKVDSELQSVRTKIGSPIDVNATFLVFINNVLQNPNYDYTIFGGSYVLFNEAPRAESTCLVLFYRGNGVSDVIDVEIISPIKEGDEVTLNDDRGFNQNERLVTKIISSNAIQTLPYNDKNVVTDVNYLRPLKHCLQTEDLFINGKEITKNREIYNAAIEPSTNIIKTISGTTDTIFVENVKTFFDNQRENSTTSYRNKLKIVSQDEIRTAILSANVSTAGTISSVTILDSGKGYITAPVISFSNPTGLSTEYRATALASISNGSISSVFISTPGIGYTATLPPVVLVDSPKGKIENITAETITGDFGYVTGISTTTVGIASTALVFNLFIPPESFLRDSNIVGTAITISGIQTGYYFTVKNTFVGSGITSLEQNGSIVSIGNSYIDNVYNVISVSTGQTFVTGIGTTTVVKVTTRVDKNNISGIGYTQIYGIYSWGRITTKPRTENNEFICYNTGITGVNSSPIIKRNNPIKTRNYT